MNDANKIDEATDAHEIEEFIKKLSGRVTNEIWVVDGRTGKRSLICTYDFDYRDTAEIVFIAEELPKEGDCEGPGRIMYEFFIGNKPGEEVDEDMAAKQKGVSQKDLEAFGEALTKANPTCEDYLHNSDIQFEDLSRLEQCRVLEHDLDNLLDLFDSFGYSEEEKQPGLLKRMFKSKTTA